MNRRIGLLVVTSLAASILLGTGTAAASSGDRRFEGQFDGRTVVVRAEHRSATTMASRASSLSSAVVAGGAPTADIQVTYNGFTAKARTAFEAAVNVWEHILVSSKPIHVKANWKPLGSGVLGSAGPTAFFLGSDDFVYPAALAEARCSCNLKSGNELVANFNSAFSSWYLETDGNTPNGKWDFYSVVLHELAHGLGFMSSFVVSGGLGYWGLTNNGVTFYPMRYDSYEMTESTGGSVLIDAYPPTGSSALRTQLTDGSVYFAGPSAVDAAGERVKLYAPSPWDPGSSNSHVDQNTYDATPESLMTPALVDGQSDGAPGPMTIAMMEDIGWTVSEGGGGPTPPANDNFADALAPGLNSVSTATTADATLETGEPSPACATATGKTVWYAYTPGTTRTIIANTVGSNFDTVLAIYTGTELASLTPVACNDNRAIDNLSKVKLTVTGGTTYWFQVGGANDASGALTFRLKRP